MTRKHELSIPGIYTITHVASGKVYVGQSDRIRRRWMSHRGNLKKSNHRNFLLQRAWNAHGPEAFVFAIYTDLSHVPSDQLIDALNAAERQALIDFPMTYNLMEAGDRGPSAGQYTRELWSVQRKKMWDDPEFRAKRSVETKAMYANNPEWKAARDAAVKEGKNTPKTKAAVSAQMADLWKTPEHQAAMSALHTAYWQDPEYRAQQKASREAAWKDPIKRQRRIDGLKAAWARRKAAEKPT
jgi:group I intron endonuclease